MGDGNHRFALHQRIQLLLNRRFNLGIQRRGGFIQHQNRGVFEQHPGDGNALALAAGELHAPLTHMSIQTSPPFGVD